MVNSKYLVINWEWLEDSLDDIELEKFYEYLERASFDKTEESYYIVNTKEPYAPEVLKLIKEGKPKENIKISKEKLLNRLDELSKLEDKEVAYLEAVETLLDYINDDVVNKAFLSVPSCFE